MRSALEYFGLPPIYSVNGHEVDDLIIWTHWLMLILFVGWGIFFTIALIKFRKGKHPKANYKGVQNHYNTVIEVAVIVIELVLLVGFSMPGWAKRNMQFPDPSKAVIIRVVAEQFAWNIHYAGVDGIFGKTGAEFMVSGTNPLGIDPNDEAGKDDIFNLNQFTIPVNKPIVVELSSKDVIHSFGLPVMRVKQDAMPGEMIPIWFEAAKTGNFHIACGQLCGIGHYRMKGYLNVKSEEEYASWMQAEQTKKAEAAAEGGDDFWD